MTGSVTESRSGNKAGVGPSDPCTAQHHALHTSKKKQNKTSLESDLHTALSNTEYDFGHNFLSKMESAKILLDAFGTAKTVKNENSTRYGKILNLYYKDRKVEEKNLTLGDNNGKNEYSDSDHDDEFDFREYLLLKDAEARNGSGEGVELVGGHFSVFGLQSHRVTDRTRRTGNLHFHVFHRLLRGLRTFSSNKLGA